MRFNRNPGRVVGLWYLLLCLLGPLRLIYIPGKLFVRDNAAATIGNLAAHQTLFRCGMLTDLASALVLIFLTLAFYRLFLRVEQGLAVLVVIFGGILPAVLDFVGVTFDLGALMIARGAGFLAAFSKPQQDALGMLLLACTITGTPLQKSYGASGCCRWLCWSTSRASSRDFSASGSPSTASRMWP